MAATMKQLELIDNLVRERVIDEETKGKIYEIARRPDASPARGGPVSQVIDGLFKLPKQGVAGAARRSSSLSDMLKAKVEVSRYAIPADQVPASAQEALGGNDHLFVHVREFKGTRYMRQLHGAPGRFTRTRLPQNVVEDLAGVLEGHCQEYSQLFGRLYTCCGVCGAELTDKRSRELALGPECRGRFGL